MEKAGLSGRQGLQKEVAGSEHGPVVIRVIDDPVVLLQTAAREIGVLHRRLVLAVTSPWANDTVKETVSSWIGMAQKGDHTFLMVDTAEKMYSDAYLDKNRRLFPVVARFTKPKNYERFYRNAEAILGFDARDELSKSKCPTLIMAGDEDKTVGIDAADELHSGIAGSELYVFKGLGHGAFEESRDFYDIVLKFISSHA